MAGRKNSSADWRVKLAKRVHKLVAKFGVEPFRAKVAKWQKELAKKNRKFKTLQDRLHTHLEQALQEPSLRDRGKRPRDGWEWCRGYVVLDIQVKVALPKDKTRLEDSVKPMPVEAWCPANLARIKEPRPLFPIGEEERPVGEEDDPWPEKYTALACIHDRYWAGRKRIIQRSDTLNRKWVEWYKLVGGPVVADSNEPYLEDFLKEVRKDLEAGGRAPRDLPDDLRVLIEDLPPDDTPKLRPAYRRDHLWLKWANELGSEVRNINATIRDRWNRIPDAHRKIIAPRCSYGIGNDRSGAETVRSRLTVARGESKTRKARSVRKRSSKSRSRKKT